MSSLNPYDSLSSWIPALACTVCDTPLHGDGARAVCANGHAFDIARQGYLNLGASQRDARADTVDMVMAREAVQRAGVFDVVAMTLAGVAQEYLRVPGNGASAEDSTRILDLAGGTGYYASRVLSDLQSDASGEAPGEVLGLVVDLSVPALKRAARAHPALAAVGADLTRGIPLRDGSVHLILNVFGPRNAGEMRRVLDPDGACLVVTPRPDHLTELVDTVEMLRVAPDKTERLHESMRGFTVTETRQCATTSELTRDEAVHLIAMGPSAHHLSTHEIEERVDELFHEGAAGQVSVTVSVDITTFVPVS